MQKKILFCILLFLIVSANFGQQIDTNFKVLDTENGLSQNTVLSLLQDRNGFIWAGTYDGLNKYNGYEFITYRSIPGDTTSLSNNIIADLSEDSQGNIWIATEGGGVCRYNPKTETFKQFLPKQKDSTSIGDDFIYVVHVDTKDRVWVGHRKGLDLYNPEKDRFERVLGSVPEGANLYDYAVHHIEEGPKGKVWFNINNLGLATFNKDSKKIEKFYGNYIDSMICDDLGTLWFSAEGIITHFNPTKDKKPISLENSDDENLENWSYFYTKTKSGKLIVQLKNQELRVLDPKTGLTEYVFNSVNSPNKFEIYSVLEDTSGSLWIGTSYNGIIYIGASTKPFHYRSNIHAKFNSRNSKPEFVKYIFEDSIGYLWLEDEQAGLVRINPKNGTKKTYPELSSYLKMSFSNLDIGHIIEDKHGAVYLLSYDLGLILLDPESGQFKTFNTFFEQNDLQYNQFTAALETKDGLIWLAGYEGFLIAYDPVTDSIEKKFQLLEPRPPGTLPFPGLNAIRIYEDLQGNLFVGFTDDGLYQLNRETDIFTKILYESKDVLNAEAKTVESLYQNKKNILWIGTANGFFKYNTETKTSIRYGMVEGLPNPVIYNILDDGVGHLWLTTNNGVSKFDLETAIFKNYGAADGLQQSEFNSNASFKSQNSDLMYLGGTKGYNFFNPKEIQDNLQIPEMVITNFKRSSAEGSFVEVPGLNYKKNIHLDYKERDFSIQFAALDYTNPAKNQYAYKLEGYNEDWVEMGTKRDVTFTSLDPDTYTLKFKGSNNDGVWNETGKSLKIKILPPWWGTWWAYAFYALMLITILYVIYRSRYNQLETMRLRELGEVKRTMYTNITHEFRTPITVISGMSIELRERLNGAHGEYLDLIDRNSQNMLYLVNQLLELRKMEIGKSEVNYIQGDIIPYLKYIEETFSTYADTKGISIHYISTVNQVVMDYDPDKLLIIISNLLSNAIKYMGSGENIYLQIEKIDEKLRIRIIDSGKGIPPKELPNIFNRFYKVLDKDSDNMDGIGIGLALTKELVLLLQGEITVTSQLGKGSVFTILLPIQQTAPLESTAEQQNVISRFPQYFQNIGADLEEKNLPIPSEDKPTILVIEDNQDIMTYLIACLKDLWNVQVAPNGKEGIEKAIEIVPDIILSDLMMPNIDGYGVLDSVKNDERTSHIPVVILTAKADEASRVEAYKKGADSYLVKPFNKTELLIVLEKLVEQRKALQQRYKTQESFIDSFETKLQKEDSFILKMEKLVLSENAAASAGIEPLCRDLAMSRTQLHNKVKALTGKSTSIFVRSIRLKKAKYLLENTNKTISDIAYDVGFNNPGYFTRSFTEEFGLTPSSLRK